MKNKVLPYLIFIMLAVLLIFAGNIMTQYMDISAEMLIIIAYIIVVLVIEYRFYSYFVKRNMLILKKIDTTRLIATSIVAIYLFSMEIGEYNILVFGIAQQTWIGIALLIVSSMWLFQSITFKNSGISRSNEFEILHFQM